MGPPTHHLWRAPPVPSVVLDPKLFLFLHSAAAVDRSIGLPAATHGQFYLSPMCSPARAAAPQQWLLLVLVGPRGCSRHLLARIQRNVPIGSLCRVSSTDRMRPSWYSYILVYRGSLVVVCITGPFNFQSGVAGGSLPQLHLNPYSWSKVRHFDLAWELGQFLWFPCFLIILMNFGCQVSNIIYLDSPAGVGMSYSRDQSDYNTGDLKTASDSHTFLLKVSEYAEYFVRFLTIHEDIPLTPLSSIQGYMVGNGVTDEAFDGDSLVPFAYGMGLISTNLFQVLFSPCQDDEVATSWLNNEAVRSAIHAQPVYDPKSKASVVGPWELCTGNIYFQHDAGSMIKYHKNLTYGGYRALIFRYTQGYEHNLTFLTIKVGMSTWFIPSTGIRMILLSTKMCFFGHW
ncbi:hypothetical protein BHM03_00019829 [Ensete ventricosum]|nr:hypothetical protein BHM03_00019829 [Ensete ventricosum]